MPKKDKKQEVEKQEIIIGYNSKGKKDKLSKTKKKKKRWEKIKRVLWVLLKIILILAVLAGIGTFLFISPVFNITSIEIENANKISENTYIVLSEIEIGENIFRISKQKIKEKIKVEAYVEDVQIKREYPGTVLISVTERVPEYMVEKSGGQYVYIDKNGYILEINTQKIDVPIVKGTMTDLESIDFGDRIVDTDLVKFNDLIKIIGAVKNSQVDIKLSRVDISDKDNYILEFEEQNKKVVLGDISDLSTKVLWIKYFIEKKKDEKGIIHLNNTKNVYFEPEE